jgi:regulatory helix-turn-helix AraC family protein
MRKMPKFFRDFFVDFRRHALSTITAVPQGHLSVRLVNDETFRRLCRARDLLAAGYQSQIFLDAAAREACLSPFHFHRLFHSTFGETPHDFLTRISFSAKDQFYGVEAVFCDPFGNWFSMTQPKNM